MDADAVAFQLYIMAIGTDRKKICHDFRQQALAGNGRGTDDQFVSLSLIFQILQGLATVQYFPGFPIDQFTLFGQHHPLAGAALNQADTQCTFQSAHMGADSGLGQK